MQALLVSKLAQKLFTTLATTQVLQSSMHLKQLAAAVHVEHLAVLVATSAGSAAAILAAVEPPAVDASSVADVSSVAVHLHFVDLLFLAVSPEQWLRSLLMMTTQVRTQSTN